jgi:acyl carrier protein
MVMTKDEIGAAVREAVVGALGVGEDEVTPEVTILGELGAESIDLLDILFRIERKSKIKVQAADLTAYVQGGIPDEEFADASGNVSAAGLAQLKKAMPQVGQDRSHQSDDPVLGPEPDRPCCTTCGHTDCLSRGSWSG